MIDAYSSKPDGADEKSFGIKTQKKQGLWLEKLLKKCDEIGFPEIKQSASGIFSYLTCSRYIKKYEDLLPAIIISSLKINQFPYHNYEREYSKSQPEKKNVLSKSQGIEEYLIENNEYKPDSFQRNPGKIIKNSCKKLGIKDEKIIENAVGLSKESIDYSRMAASIYLVSEKKLTQKQICDFFGITEDTLRAHVKYLLK